MKEANKLNKKTSKINLQRTSKMYNKERGITLIALVITIIILIILATVTITLVFGEGGLIQRAQEGKTLTEQAQKDEQDELKGAEEFINGVLAGTTNPPEESTPIEEAKPNPNEDGPKFEDTTRITDDLDNEVTIPGGFHLDKDSGTKVEEGIVIEDDSGNQFVWVPVGEYNVSTTINSTGKLTNELSRRTFTESGSTLVSGDDAIAGDEVEEYNEYFYGEENENSVAKDQIDFFKNSSTTNKGFYIGRYEAGTETERTARNNPLTIPLVQADKYPYIWVKRNQAKEQAEAMYSENEFVTSELISSYAWDTALNFVCQTNEEGYLLATTTDSAHGNIGTSYSDDINRTKTGEYEADNYSNIHDLLGNCTEWTTEYSSYFYGSNVITCVYRGGTYHTSARYSSFRNSTGTANDSKSLSFRLQLYINPES
jgi:type II secretory pathway pseudopilin PulG